jgi:hypothetical protein
MNKRNLVILSLIISAISLVYIILMYFGIIRYLKLHVKTAESYITGYSSLDKANEEGRVIISFTTTPKRIGKIRPMLLSLLDQTVKVDQIALNIPYKYQDDEYEIPREFTDILNVFRASKDYGTAIKFVPTLLREGETGTNIIYVSDNYIYGADFIETIVNASKENPDVAIHTKNSMRESEAVLIKPEFFNTEVLGHEQTEFPEDWASRTLQVEKMKLSYCENYKCLTNRK